MWYLLVQRGRGDRRARRTVLRSPARRRRRRRDALAVDLALALEHEQHAKRPAGSATLVDVEERSGLVGKPERGLVRVEPQRVERRVPAEPEMRIGRLDREPLPLAEDRVVGRLLQLDDQRAAADRVRDAGGTKTTSPGRRRGWCSEPSSASVVLALDPRRGSARGSTSSRRPSQTSAAPSRVATTSTPRSCRSRSRGATRANSRSGCACTGSRSTGSSSLTSRLRRSPAPRGRSRIASRRSGPSSSRSARPTARRGRDCAPRRPSRPSPRDGRRLARARRAAGRSARRLGRSDRRASAEPAQMRITNGSGTSSSSSHQTLFVCR